MAYTPVVTKTSITQVKENLYHVSIGLVVSDGVEEVFKTDVTGKYSTGDSLANLQTRLINTLKEKWDKYAAENNLFTSAAFDTLIDNIQTAAENYIT